MGFQVCNRLQEHHMDIELRTRQDRADYSLSKVGQDLCVRTNRRIAETCKIKLELEKLDEPRDPDVVDKIMEPVYGPKWCTQSCELCRGDFDKVVCIGDCSGKYAERNVYVCAECLQKALDMLKGS